MNFLFLKIPFILFFLIICSCKKSDKGNCYDGQLSEGELQIDCGGICPPCESIAVNSFLLASVNNIPMQFSNRTLDENPFILSFWNDTIDVQLHLGNLDSIGIYFIEHEFSQMMYSNINYTNLSFGHFLMTSNDETNRIMSGYFEATFINYALDSINNDTVRIKNGEFLNLTY